MSDSAPIPTLRQLAQLAGVSAMTVSMALRNHPRISAATRAKIQLLARQHAYRPDPALNKLMLHLRTRRTRRLLRGSICALFGSEWQDDQSKYAKTILDSSRAHAEKLGFAFDVLGLEEMIGRRGRLRRIVRNRSVDGLLILPMPKIEMLPDDIGWEDVAVVSATYSVLKPEFHRVVPNQFDNARLLCGKLVAHGFRRIGLALEESYDARVNHHCSAAIAWQSQFGGSEFIPPFVFNHRERDKLVTWVREVRPNVIIVSENEQAVETARVLKEIGQTRVRVVCTSWFPGQRFPGIDERPGDIGIKSVDLLASMILRSERGVPAISTVTMLAGRWHRVALSRWKGMKENVLPENLAP